MCDPNKRYDLSDAIQCQLEEKIVELKKQLANKNRAIEKLKQARVMLPDFIFNERTDKLTQEAIALLED